MTSQPDKAAADQIMAADEQNAGEAPEPDPTGAWLAGDIGPPAAAVRESPGLALVTSPAPVTEIAPEPAVAGTRTDTSTDSPSPDGVATADREPATASVRDSDNAVPGGRWHEIQAMFVDDPRASTALAASLVSDRVDALVTSVRDRRLTLESAWQGQDAGTEELRLALQHYRAFWNQIDDFPAGCESTQ